MAITKTIQSQVLELRSIGKSYADIASELHIARQSVVNVCRDNAVALQTLEGIFRDNLIQTAQVSATHRLQSLASTLNSIQVELAKRDFTEVSTEKLCELSLKYAAAISQSLPSIDVQSDAEMEKAKRGSIFDILNEI